MNAKIGRNDVCWCNSGKKYKKCHLNREKADPISIFDADKILRKERNKKDCCVYSSLKSFCNGGVIKAHTITRSTSLKEISRNNHVYGFQVSIENISKNNGILKPVLIGINQASTFTGFCRKHDDELFADIEKKPFMLTKHECLLHAYRALIREYFVKRSVVNTGYFRAQFDSGKSIPEQILFQNINQIFSAGSKVGLRDIEKQKDSFEKILATQDYACVNAVILRFQKFPSVLASGAKYPIYDFSGGNLLQDLADLSITPCSIYYNAFCSEGNGYFTFTWLNESDNICRLFVNSLKKICKERLSDAVIRFLFSSCENIYMSPVWWESLDNRKRETLVERLARAVNLVEDYKSDYLMDDGMLYDDWSFDSFVDL